MFHTSCLIHWILLCEFEIFMNQLVSPKPRRSSRRKSGSKCNRKGKKGMVKPTTQNICSVFCPECQGTGIMIEGDELEMPHIPLSEVWPQLNTSFISFCGISSSYHLFYYSCFVLMGLNESINRAQKSIIIYIYVDACVCTYV